MQTSNHSGGISAGSESGNVAGLNGRPSYVARNGPAHPVPDNFIFEQVDPTRLDGDDESDCDLSPTPVHFSQDVGQGQSTTPSGLKPGKKTKGRVKIKMEFIENKLRRYTTFSKRKTGIMKKAYELSTLTGTQVMLLVASETGHVYTFATRKLQPMITSDSGKALIQTCLNSPDPPPGSTGPSSLEQRMNPSGFEETELTYSVVEDDPKLLQDAVSGKPMMQLPTITPQSTIETQAAVTSNPTASATPTVRPAQQPSNTSVAPITSFTSQPITMATHTVAAVSSSESGGNKVTGIPLQLPSLILQTAGNGQPVAIPAGQLSVSTSTTQPQTIYRTATGQIVTNQSQTTSASAETTSVATPSTLSFLSGSGAAAVTPSQIIMYQTPQGVVYATPTPSATLGDRTIFNFQQPAHAISIPQPESVAGGQQIITIPVPVSLASTPQVLQLSTSAGEAADIPVQAPPAKKSRK